MFTIEQGIFSKRFDTLNWRGVEKHVALGAAKKSVREFVNAATGGKWRITETHVIWHSDVDK